MQIFKDAPRWGLKWIDLNDDSPLQQVVDWEKGQYLGHPTTVTLNDGQTVLIVYPKGHGRGEIVYQRSNDRGHTWSGRLPIPESWKTSREVPTLFRMTDPAGKNRIILFSGLYPIRRAYSEDDGLTWSELEPIGDFGGIVAMGECIELKDGSYMALFHDDGRFFEADRGTEPIPPVFRIYKTLSFDGGLTWTHAEPVIFHGQAHICEPGMIRSPDEQDILILMRENSRKFNAFMSITSDEGKTFHSLRQIPEALTGDRHCLRYLPDGRLFISFRDMAPHSPTRGDWVAWVGTYEDILKDRPGQYRIRLKKDYSPKGGDCAYPAIEVYENGEILTTTYGHWEQGEMPYILSIRLNMKEIDAAFS